MEITGTVVGGDKIVNFEDLEIGTQELISKAVGAREMAYCVYSGFKVGAALRTSSGEIIPGCNVENGAYSPTICAERCAIGKAVIEGFQTFKEVAVVAFQEDSFVSPCGVCRQTLSEFAGNDFPVYLAKPDKRKVLVTSVHRLLPYRFEPEMLKKY